MSEIFEPMMSGSCRQMILELATEKLQSMPSDHPERGPFLEMLSDYLFKLYKETGQTSYLEQAIVETQKRIDLIPDHLERKRRLGDFGARLLRLYGETGNDRTLEEAVPRGRRAIESARRNNPRRGVYISLDHQFRLTGQMTHLERAIAEAREAIKLIPHRRVTRAKWLCNLGGFLHRRYERTGQMHNLDEAIVVARQAIEAIASDDPGRPAYLDNLASHLRLRYERTDDTRDLEEAITITGSAIDTMLPENPIWAACSSNLGALLHMRYDRFKNMADLEHAITRARKALASTPIGYRDRATRLNHLGVHHSKLYQRTGKIGDLEEAIRVGRLAVGSTPDNHPGRATFLFNLGEHESRYEEYLKTREGESEQNGQIGCLVVDALSSFLQAWQCEAANPFTRIEAGRQCLPLLRARGKLPDATELGQAIIDLLPSVNTKLLSRSDQQFVMRAFAGIAAEVCALLIASDQPARALQCLEEGRAVIIGQLLDARGDMSDLERQHPELARQYKQLQDEVDLPLDLEQYEGGQHAASRQSALKKLYECARDIRNTAGNERFLLGQTVAEMQECAAKGTIVIVNITEFRSDAILVSRTALQTINLPQLLVSDATDWLSRDWTVTGEQRHKTAQKNRDYLKYLDWLWDVCVGPIFNEIDGTKRPADSVPRIWWIGTGLGSSMPFHAAGKHSPDSTENALTKAISSYTPSIKALGYSQHRSSTTDPAHGSLLIATMPTTPEFNNGLLHVVEEKDKITKTAAPRHIPIESLDLPSVDQMVDKLHGCSIAHFACHGKTDHSDPSNSGLILQKQLENQGAKLEQDRLTVKRISALNLPHAYIAYLSACSTAENNAEKLSDEVIHVVSGFQVAGFPHVVGCLWKSNDRVCVEVATKFYEFILSREPKQWDGHAVASAVRDSVMAVRGTDMDMEMPLLWAPFVHYGV